ncbi:MetS family NSS transporter small subunit [Fulvivirga ligni]|nr:MetS family NSS transporter small subunit [Fulvivirga ligni]UII21323.1 MetS family NSS transporter small subunit [Fulvivirga ligni]
MSAGAIISMICILGTVAGGFVYFLSLAMKNEARRKREK